MITPEDPPGFVVRTEAQKAAWDNGFRLERGAESGGWLRYGSTTARGEIWIAGVPPRGPWLLSIDHPGVAAELATLQSSPLPGPGLVTFGPPFLAAFERVDRPGELRLNQNEFGFGPPRTLTVFGVQCPRIQNLIPSLPRRNFALGRLSSLLPKLRYEHGR